MQQCQQTSAPPLQLAIIGGPYKSGTSLLCWHLESRGYRNPASFTNACEHGHGLSAGIYLTRESSPVRDWNQLLLHASPKNRDRIERHLSHFLLELAKELGPRVVLKDPYMKLTAQHWVRACRSLRARSTLLLTARDVGAVHESWANSRFLTMMRDRHHDEFEQLTAPLSTRIRAELSALDVTPRIVRYGSLPGTIQPPQDR